MAGLPASKLYTITSFRHGRFPIRPAATRFVFVLYRTYREVGHCRRKVSDLGMTDTRGNEHGLTRSSDTGSSTEAIFGPPFEYEEHFLRDMLVLVGRMRGRVGYVGTMDVETAGALGVPNKGLVVQAHGTRAEYQVFRAASSQPLPAKQSSFFEALDHLLRGLMVTRFSSRIT